MSEAFRAVTKPGDVTWSGIKQELMNLPKETMADLIDIGVRNYWTCQNYWMTSVEKYFGFDNAGKLDAEVFEPAARAQAYRLKKVLELGDDTQALATVLKLTAPQWVNAGFEWEFLEITDRKIVIRIRTCPMGTSRSAQNLPLLPCKLAASPLYVALARVINEKFRVTCLHAHPDPRIEGVMCEWEFVLGD